MASSTLLFSKLETDLAGMYLQTGNLAAKNCVCFALKLESSVLWYRTEAFQIAQLNLELTFIPLHTLWTPVV